ncbi:YncE family protein [Ruegeria meonggei]|uniref:Virginiamycin B lyase n=1 Tax=Ruegeria meonggei TaxID=1446476 RepID=A0A1X7A3I9_9RHOB|nr:beta-propeller fold lactonase family protein [Ruegeria meonggei]SLN69486.1 Virginiamycin B lyase [Ruegeria meonggei]
MRWSSVLVRQASRLFTLPAAISASMALAETAFITCQNGEELSRIDLSEMQETARWPLPGKPAGVAAGLDGTLFTVSPDSKTVRRLSSETGETIAQVVLDGGPIGIVLDSTGGRVFVSDWYNARLWVLDGENLEVLTELPTGTAPAGIAISADGRFLASANKDADQVSVFDAETLQSRHRITVGIRPFGLRFAPDGRLFVGNVGSNDVSVIDVDTGTVTATVPVGERPYGIAFAQGHAFVTNQYANTLSVFSLKTLEHEALIEVGEYPEGIDATARQDLVVVANWFDNTVSIVDPKALSVIETIETCDGPRAFGSFLKGGRQ